MLVYVTIFSVLAATGLAAGERLSRQLLPFAILFLLFFMGTRYFVGCDFTGYLNRFENAGDFNALWHEIFEREAGFNFLLTSVAESNLDYMWLNFAASAIFLVCTYFFCKAHPKPLMVLALLFPILIIQLAMSGLRQALGVGFIMLSTVFFIHGRKAWAAAMILVAATFHASAIAFLPLSLLAGRRVTSARVLGALVLLTPVAALLLGDRADVYADRYIDEIYGESSSGGALFRYGMVVIPALVFLRYKDSLHSRFPQVYGLLQVFVLLIFALLPVAFFSSLALHRLTYYVMPVSIVLLVYESLLLAPKKTFAYQRFLPVLLYGGYSVAWFLASGHAASCYLPYQSYWLL